MAFCEHCGAKIDEGVKFCPGCGAACGIPEQPPVQAETQPQTDFSEKFAEINNTEDNTAEHDANDISDNKFMAVLAYLGILFLIPLLAAPNSKFARYHVNQGLTLCICEIVFGIVYSILSSIIYAISWRLGFVVTIIGIIGIVFPILAVIGIINASGGKAKALPIIGGIKILK